MSMPSTGQHDGARQTRLLETLSGALGRAQAWLGGFWLSGNRIVSQPKLLFTVAVADLLTVAVTGLLSQNLTATPPPASTLQPYLYFVVAVTVVVLLRWNWSYSISAFQNRTSQFTKIARAILMAFMIAAGTQYITDTSILPGHQIWIWALFAASALFTSRIIVSKTLSALAKAGHLSRRTVLVGSGSDADLLMNALLESDAGDLDILGFFDDRQDERSTTTASSISRLGTFDKLAQFCQDEQIDLVIVSVPIRAEQRILEILQELFEIRVDIRISALNAKLRLNANAYKYIGNIPVLAVMDKPLDDWDRAIKNIEDRVLAACILILAAPVMALVALAVRLDSKGPVFFKQRRYGFNNQLVEVYKFRSMHVEQSDATASKLVTRDDSRVTRVGRFIRRTSLDELPQLFNVLTGEMSLVGPRPHATQAKAGGSLYQDVVHGYLARHRVKPGITGWAQICGWRGETDTPEKIRKRVECDLYYIDNWSVRFDLYVIAMTPISLLTGKNAY